MKNRIELAEHFRDQGYLKGVEVGVCDGRYSEILMETIPGLELFGIDPYAEHDKDSKGRKQDDHDGNLAKAWYRLGKYSGYRLIICKSLVADDFFEDGSLDFVFIDANHRYEYVKEDIEAWYPKVREGGILSGHDYYEFQSGRGGVVRAVDEFVRENGLKLEITEWDYEAYADDQQPDWIVRI